ncbi:MAG: hypothetical protein IJX85_11760 [Lachnospiraceae bacterium]|nr:hypothetical protein [Lachnospiraceae bacterium]
MKKYICEGLADYLAKDVAPWHMPGHKRKYNTNQALSLAYKMDVTEVPGTDDLHHPEDMILKSQKELARIYGTYASYYMVNGSTGGILATVGAVVQQARGRLQNPMADQDTFNPQIIIARNCHKSVYNAVQLFNLKPIYIEPQFIDEITHCPKMESEQKSGAQSTFGKGMEEKNAPHIYGGILPQQIKELVEENPDVVAVVITSPTYEGLVSDVAGIKKVLEPYQIPLIVDEAHGAHLTFIDELPRSAVNCGGDIVVQSLHKTLPALTQTAILHVNNPLYDEAVRKYLSVFMSSSPSYVMLCSMESAVACAEEIAQSERGFNDYVRALKEFRCKCENFSNLRLLDMSLLQADEKIVGSQAMVSVESQVLDGQDISRLVIYTCNEHIHSTGQQLENELRNNHNIQVEMSGLDYVVLISTFADEEQDFDRLYEALKQMDGKMQDHAAEMMASPTRDDAEELRTYQTRDDVTEFATAHSSLESLEVLRDQIGTRSKSNIYVYPPGSYIVTEGEVITAEAVNTLEQLAGAGKKIYGV